MNNFEKILDEAKKIANIAVDKTEELARTGKIKLDIKQAEYEIKKIYEKIGKACYDGVKADIDNSEEISDLIKKVDEISEKIEELKML